MKAYLLIAILMHVNFICASAGSAAAASASASSGTSAGSAAASPAPGFTGYEFGLRDIEILFSGDSKRLAAFGIRRLPNKSVNKHVVQIYSIDQTTGALTPTMHSPWEPQISLPLILDAKNSLSLSFDGNVIALFSKGHRSKFEIYWTDSGKSASENVRVIPDPRSIILSPNGQWLLIFGLRTLHVQKGGTFGEFQEEVEIYKINKEKNTIEFVHALLLRDKLPNAVISNWKFSPNGAILFGSRSGSLLILDFNNRTGQISTPDGNVLSSLRPEKEYEEAHKALVESIPQKLDKNSASILEEYILGPKPAKEQEKTSNEELQGKIEKTQAQEKSHDQ